MNPLISVIMPVYNNERFLPNAVESVLTQDFENFELIIVDDGSTDNTPAMADAYAASDKRVRVIHQENQWIFPSMNNGIREARGEYVYILNSDDKLCPGALQRFADIAAEHSPDVVWTVIVVHKCDSDQSITQRDIHDAASIADRDIFINNAALVRSRYLLFFKLGLASNQANLYRTSIASKHLFRGSYTNADWFFNLAIAPDLGSAYISFTPAYEHYVFENGQNTSQKFNLAAHDMLDDFHHEFVKTFKALDIWDSDAEEYIADRRLRLFSHELTLYNTDSCTLSAEEKISRLFSHDVNELLYDCAVRMNMLDWLEHTVLLFCIELFSGFPISADFEYYFIFDMLTALYSGNLTGENRKIIEAGIYHSLNPLRIGKITYGNMISSTHFL